MSSVIMEKSIVAINYIMEKHTQRGELVHSFGRRKSHVLSLTGRSTRRKEQVGRPPSVPAGLPARFAPLLRGS